MFNIVVSLVILSLTQGFILVEEELLIIIASIVWIDAAGKMIKDLLENEVDHKSKLIKEKYMWFLLKKKELEIHLIEVYNKRLSFLNWINKLQTYIILLLVNNSISYFFTNFIILKWYDINSNLISMGLIVIKEILSTDINNILKVLDENSIYLNKYTNLNYIQPFGNFNNVEIETI